MTTLKQLRPLLNNGQEVVICANRGTGLQYPSGYEVLYTGSFRSIPDKYLRMEAAKVMAYYCGDLAIKITVKDK